MKLLSARMYAYFLLAALTLALPPTALVTVPTIALIAWAGHRSRRARSNQRAWKAYHQHERDVRAAMRSL